jgi:hypothetical protein
MYTGTDMFFRYIYLEVELPQHKVCIFSAFLGHIILFKSESTRTANESCDGSWCHHSAF